MQDITEGSTGEGDTEEGLEVTFSNAIVQYNITEGSMGEGDIKEDVGLKRVRLKEVSASASVDIITQTLYNCWWEAQ